MSAPEEEAAVARSGRVAAIGLGVLALAYGIGGALIAYDFSSDPLGPRAVPVILAVLLAVFAGWYFLRPQGGEPWPSLGDVGRQGLFLAAIVIAVALLNEIGFFVAATIMGGVTAWLFGAAPVRALIIGLVQAAFWNLLFTCALATYLPTGRFVGALVPASLKLCG